MSRLVNTIRIGILTLGGLSLVILLLFSGGIPSFNNGGTPDTSGSFVELRKIDSNAPQIQSNLYFNLTMNEIQRCVFLQTALSTLASSGEISYSAQANEDEMGGIWDLFIQKSGQNPPFMAFKYEESFFEMVLSSG